jgi:hypothetical protein
MSVGVERVQGPLQAAVSLRREGRSIQSLIQRAHMAAMRTLQAGRYLRR